MGNRLLLFLIILLTTTGNVQAQQVPDLKYKPIISRPAYESGKGPRVAIDEAHYNFHTSDGRYRPFAEFLRRDGYRVDALRKPLSSDALKTVDVLVIANPLHKRNVNNWALPTPSAFKRDEIVDVRNWVEKGGSLFLIADHMPIPGAVGDLAKSFGVEFSNGYARAGHWKERMPNTFDFGTGLKKSAVTQGRAEDETVRKVVTFGGSAFKAPKDATPVLVFGSGSLSFETKKVAEFKPDTPTVPIEGWCQGAIMIIGNGRVAIFGEAAMFSAQLSGAAQKPMGMNSPEAKQNHQLLLNVMHWLTRAKGMPN